MTQREHSGQRKQNISTLRDSKDKKNNDVMRSFYGKAFFLGKAVTRQFSALNKEMFHI